MKSIHVIFCDEAIAALNGVGPYSGLDKYDYIFIEAEGDDEPALRLASELNEKSYNGTVIVVGTPSPKVGAKFRRITDMGIQVIYLLKPYSISDLLATLEPKE